VRIGVYGNLTLDELDRNGRSVVYPGGTALYSSLAAAYLGAKVSVFSRVGRDYPRNILSIIKDLGIDVSRIEKSEEPTTRFKISYHNDSRQLTLVHSGRRPEPTSIKGSLEAIHLGPVFQEVGPDTLSLARRHAKFVSLDVQGLLRTTGKDGLVHLARRKIDTLLLGCNLVKATEEEAQMIEPSKAIFSSAKKLVQKGAQFVIITRGRSGSLMMNQHGMAFHVPSVPEKRAVDLTGAGDIFVGSWLETFLSVGDALWAGALGSAFASLSARAIGISKFRIDRRELFRRASWAYKNSERI
jgi:sugar/nucleoside kinase (ribokinase family)